MTSIEVQTIRRVISLLCSLIGEPHECAGVPAGSAVRRFVRDYLAADANAEITCQESWTYFQEIVTAGELTPTRKAAFLRELPMLMEAVFHVRKCHHIQRDGHRQRGFRGVGIRSDA